MRRITRLRGIAGLGRITGLRRVTGLRGVARLGRITGLRRIAGLRRATWLRWVARLGRIAGLRGIPRLRRIAGLRGVARLGRAARVLLGRLGLAVLGELGPAVPPRGVKDRVELGNVLLEAPEEMHPAVLCVEADCVGCDDAGARGDGGDHRGRHKAVPALAEAALPGDDVGEGDEDVGVGGGRRDCVAELENKDNVEAVDDDVGAVHLVVAVGAAGPEVPDELLGLGEVEAAAELGVDCDGVDAAVEFLADPADNVAGVDKEVPS